MSAREEIQKEQKEYMKNLFADDAKRFMEIQKEKLRITEVQIKVVKPKDGLIGFASLVLGKELYLSSIGIFSKLDGGYRITYPTKKVGNSDLNIFHPIKEELGKLIENAVIEKAKTIFEAEHTENQ